MDIKSLTKKLTIGLLILIAIAIIIIAFVGVYVPNLNKLTNIIPDYTYGSEVNGVIEYRFNVDKTENEQSVYVDNDGKIRGQVSDGSETSAESYVNETGYVIKTEKIKANEDSALTKENYEKTKSIIEKRLNSIGATEYSIRLNDKTGEMIVELSSNDNVSYLYQTGISTKGEFRVIDSQTGVVLLDASHLAKAGTTTYSADGATYTVLLQLELTNEGAEILKDISKKYVQYTDENGETKTDYISFQIDGSSIYTTYFGEEYTANVINIPVGQDIDDPEIIEAYLESTDAIAKLLNLGALPVTYTGNGGYLIESGISDLFVLRIALIVALVIVVVMLTVKYKLNGFVAGILNAAFAGTLILVLKYLSIVISISAMISFVAIIVANILFIKKYLEKIAEGNEVSYTKSLLGFYGLIFPIIVVAFIFTLFSTNASITGIGMILFWGLLLEIIFNAIFVRTILPINKD